MRHRAVELSVVTPVFNESESLRYFYNELVATLVKLKVTYEIVFVNDGSTDDSQYVLDSIKSENGKCVKVLTLPNNLGQSRALVEGLKNATGEFCVTMDSDMQQDPVLLETMWNFRHKAPVIQMIQKKRKDAFLKRILSSGFYKLLSFVAGFKFVANVGEFRLMSKGAYNKIISEIGIDEVLRFGIQKRGFDTFFLNYEANPRRFGDSKYGIAKMSSLALESIATTTKRPLYLAILVSSFFILFTLMYSSYVFFEWLSEKPIPGWTSLVLLTSSGFFFMALILIALGIYVAHNLNLTRLMLKEISDLRLQLNAAMKNNS